MQNRFRFLGAVALLAASWPISPAWANPAVPSLPPELTAAAPVDVLPADPKAFEFRDSINLPEKPGAFAYVSQIEGEPLYRAVNNKGAVNHYGISSTWRTARPIAKGDVILARFSARALHARQESGEAEGFFYIKGTEAGAENVAVQTFSVGPEWTYINVPFVAPRDFAAGEATASFTYGQLDQSFEVAGLEILDFDQRVAVADLPVTRFSYAGREDDAPWRKAALARIEELRTAPLTVRVVDRRGRPVAGARVEAAMIRSDFAWGSSVSAERLVEESPDGERYRRAVVDLFDVAVIENGFKWPRWRQPEYRARALRSLDWLREQSKLVKGHNLAWPGWKFSPSDIAGDPAARAKIAPLVEAHIGEITAATKGKLIGWDVVNEPVHETDYYKHMPRERIAEWFKLAEASDPALELTLNEYGMLNRSSSPLMIADMLAFSRMLKANGARVDILGVQGHVGQTPRPPAAVLSDLDLLAADGQEIQITEYDFNTRDEALQADYTRDFLIALYSHPSVTGFIQWGFWESAHWKPAAAMFRPDWSEKPNLKVWRDLVLDAWRSKVDATTAADGTVDTKGHLGTYRVTAATKDKSGSVDYRLAKGGGPLVITVE